MLRVVVDTNIWVSVIIKPYGRYARMVETITEKGELFTAEEILAEARDVVLRPRIKDKYHLTEAGVDEALNEARATATLVSNLPEIDVVKEDPDDNVAVGCAVKADADYLVSYDPHLTELEEYQGITIIHPEQFIPILQQIGENKS